MKKYKLIKEFPGSPKLGTINTNDQLSWKGEDYPEFWEEVVEKDYEILEYKTESGISCKAPFLSDSHQFYINEKCKIHSVKRLSDGEIFTIGDKIKQINNNNDSFGLIHRFDISNDSIIINKKPNTNCLFLKSIEHIKQPLFTTEDGVDIFEGDEYFELITPDFHNKPCIWNILPNKTRNNINYDQKGNKEHGRIWFSTKEKAEEYILMNKPCLSFNDISNLFPGYIHSSSNFIPKLKDLIKTKLKND